MTNNGDEFETAAQYASASNGERDGLQPSRGDGSATDTSAVDPALTAPELEATPTQADDTTDTAAPALAAEAADTAAPDDNPMPLLPPVPTGLNAIPEQTAKLGATLIGAELTIAVAESLTGGAVVAELVRVPGISASLQGAIVAYQVAAKHELLGVNRELLDAQGAVDPDVAIQMAKGVRRRFSFPDEKPVDIGISTTGVAGPEPADGKAAGTVYIGIDSIFGERVVHLDFHNLVRADDPVGSRQRIRLAVVEAAVFNLLEHLAEQIDN